MRIEAGQGGEREREQEGGAGGKVWLWTGCAVGCRAEAMSTMGVGAMDER